MARRHHQTRETRALPSQDLPGDALNYAGFFQSPVSAVLVDRFEAARSYADAHKLFQLRHPDAVLVQVRRENTRHIFCHVPANAALFLGHTAPVNDAAARRSRSCDDANS